VKHVWEPFEAEDALGPSVFFQWYRCGRCGANVRTHKNTSDVKFLRDDAGRETGAEILASLLKIEMVDEDCDGQIVTEVHRL
jgi:hypothetical protein